MGDRIRLEEGWSTLVLLITLIFVAAYGVSQSEFFEGLGILPELGVTAVLTGVLVAKSRFSTRLANFFAIILGTFTIVYGVASVLPGDLTWRQGVIEVVSQQITFLQKLISGGTNREGFVFVTHAGLAIWMAGYTAAWYTFRHPKIWRAIIPAGLILFSVVYYYAGPEPMAVYMAIYIVLALLFVARTHLVEQEKQWRLGSVRYERFVWFNFLRAGLIASLLALMISWSLPTLSASAAVSDALSDTRAPWRRFQDNWTRMYSALRTYGQTTVDPYQDSLILGGPRTVGDTPVMDIFVERQLPYVYWQTIVYDQYRDGGWYTSPSQENLHITDEGVLNVPFTISRQVITQTVVNYQPNSSLIYGAPEVIGADRDMFVQAREDGGGDSLVTTLRSRFVLKQGDQYEVTSRFSVADAFSLRSAPTVYPEWVTETYLQIPDSITPETVALAEEITAVYDNPFDKAIAVRDYLRANVAYNDQIPAPPADAEPVHYTLFVSQEGYCNYYASAMAIMLRSQGIPTRVVSGYAQGEFNEDSNYYRVRQSNAHTWAEVYFPDYGWIQFEPTAAIPVVDRPENSDGGGGDAFGSFNNTQGLLDREDLLGEEGFTDESDPNSLNDLLPEDEDVGAAGLSQESWLQRLPVWQIVTGIFIIGLATVLSVAGTQYNQKVEADVNRSYGRLERWGRWLGLVIRPAHTPYERADLITTAVPESQEPVQNLTQQYVLNQFSSNKERETDFDPTFEWRNLRPVMIRSTLVHGLNKLRNRLSRRKR